LRQAVLQIAQTMVERKHLNILLDFAPVTEFQRQIVLGVTNYCQEHLGFRLRTANSEINIARDADAIDGVIAIIDRADANHRATRFGKPVINVSSIAHPVPFPTVTIDNRALGRLAAQHLIQQGYRSFAFHMESRVFFSRERQAGFAVDLEKAGYATAVFDTAALDSATPAEVHAATLAWIRMLPKPLGLFTHNDQRATGLVDLCGDAGIAVPDEVGVIGSDNDLLITGACKPNLSSLDPGASLIGYRAAEWLGRIIHGMPVTDEAILLPPRAVVARASTAPRRFSDERLTAAITFIRENATLGVSVDEVADASNCSRRSLERLFGAHLGHSPAEEIRRGQIHHAMWLLAQSDRTLSDVSRKCGYTAFRNFATAFKRTTGLTPKAYRRKVRS
jgi:LacI family transcriptional regulator